MPIQIKPLPSYDDLHHAFECNFETGIVIWKNSNCDSTKPGDIAGYEMDGYIRLCLNNRRLLAHRVIWKMYYNEEPNFEIDHINCFRNDNRICNLRKADRFKNLANVKLNPNNLSGIKGVSYHKFSGLWRARITINYKEIVIGYFKTKEEAGIARKAYAEKIHGEYAREGKDAEIP